MLALNNIRFSYKKKQVLKGITLNLSDGVYGLLGPNGSGKTTLLRCITGIIRPQEGTIEKPFQIGYLPQTFGMYPELTIYEVLNYFATIKEISSVSREESIMSVLALVNLEEQASTKVGKLSGGMLRRLGIAQAILGNPELIIFDEPTAGLDPEERLRFKNLISTIGRRHTILIATHIVDDIDSLCDNIIILNNGTVICEETKEELQSRTEGCVYHTISQEKSNLTTPYTITSEKTENGIDYIRVLSPNHQPGTKLQPTLEDAYMFVIKGYYETRNNKNCI